jgi:hypothetical protein
LAFIIRILFCLEKEDRVQELGRAIARVLLHKRKEVTEIGF